MRLRIRLTIAGVAAGLLLAGCGTAPGPTSPASSAPGRTTPGGTGSGSPAPAGSSFASTPAPSPAPAPFAYQPLFPFANPAQVRGWQASYASGGHQPWHLNAGETALAFAAYLGFPGIDKVAGQTGTASDAHVSVGYRLPNGRLAVAAVVHLVRYGSGRYVPWEVVGTDDTTLSLDTPAYGSTVSSPVKIGGTITGVDENLKAEVHALATSGAVGGYCCQAAGGQHSSWSLTVPFRARSGSVLTVAVHTGGHVAAVERFAVTAIRAG